MRHVIGIAVAAAAAALTALPAEAGPATHFAISAPASATAGTGFIFTVTALDVSNNIDTGYSGTVHFTSTDGGATLPANTTLSNGTGTFPATLNTAGNQTITATDTVNSSITGTSNSILTSAANATHFSISAPASVNAGTAFTFTVTALDQFNNTAVAYGGTVHFTSSDSGSGTTVPANANLTNGVGTFSATLVTAGSRTVTATDTVNSSITGTSNSIVVNAVNATHFAVTAPASATAGTAFSFTVTALDQFNNTATTYIGAVHFTSSDSGSGTTVPANSSLSGGVGTFSATLVTAGGQTLTATDTGNSSITGTSNAIVVQATNATHFAISAPASANAGNAFSFTVTALDQFNNVATGYGGTVHFTSTDGAAVIPANSTLSAGIATFSATLKTAGNQTITATDTVNSSITGTSNSILVSSSGATHFSVSAPASVNAGTAFAFTVTALDQFNNTVTAYGGTVHFTSSDGGSGTTVPANANLTNGVGTFSATLVTAGSRTITATDTVNSSITGTSNAIVVNAVAATHFAVTAPATVATNNPFNFTVTALDQFNNTVTGYGGTVHFTSTDGSATLPANSTLSGGTGTFSGTLLTLGAQTITATDTANSAITGTSSTINVVAATTTHFAVTAPASATAGTAFSVTVTALDQFNNIFTGYTGTVHFSSSDASATLPANSTLSNGTGTFSVTLRTGGAQGITATDTANPTITGTATTTVSGAASTTTLTSSQNPSTLGQAVTFTAKVTGTGTPSGAVTFKDGATALGTVTLNGAGQATFTTSSLAVGAHSMTAAYGGDSTFAGSTSAVLTQTVNVPADSLRLRAMQLIGTKIEAQASGQAISGAIDSAISEGFDGGGAPVVANDNGVRFNFAAEPQARTERRVGDAFAAFGYAPQDNVVKAPPRGEPKVWIPWAEVRGTGWSTSIQTGDIRGDQTNTLLGLTRRLTPDLLVGALGGYERFDYTSQLLAGRLNGNGWTVGGYLGWRPIEGLRVDAGLSHAWIAYDAAAGTAAASFPGQRWLATLGLTGTYRTAQGLAIEPSARVYALWEHEDAYLDSLGVTQATRDFASGRASTGVKLAYPLMWSPSTKVAPYVGVYADYYFNSDNGTLPTGTILLPTEFIQGWSARVTSGISVSTRGGASFSVGGEVGGLGSGQFDMWSVRGRASLPF